MAISLEAAQDCGGNSGPYRRVWSLCGYSWMAAAVYLPSESQREVQYGGASRGDTSFVYSGGWSSTGQAADAGFMHNVGADNWSLFMKLEGRPEQFDPDGTRFAGSQDVNLKFWVDDVNVLKVAATGVTTDGTSQTVEISIADGPDGWTPSGIGMVLKRMTSIGQDAEDFATGSYLHNVHWRNVQIGLTNGAKTPWLSAQTGGQCMYPSGSSIIVVNFVNQAEEYDNISL